jgi:hypothetical protein
VSRHHPKTEWEHAEDAFRLMAFHTAYDRTLRGDGSADRRFLRALELSSRPIPAGERATVMAWYRRAHPDCNRQEGRERRRRKENHP